MNEDQLKYNQFVQTTAPTQQEMLSGGFSISPGEKHFFDTYAKTSVLDIGCGTGNRTLAEFNRRNLKATGIEKFENVINSSNFKSQIIRLDIADTHFLEHPCFLEHYDIAVCVGGVICGFVDPEVRRQAWLNLSRLLISKCTDYLLVDTITNFTEFNTRQTGEVKAFYSVPPQYFYSKAEMYDIFESNQLVVVEEITNVVSNIGITYFLLKFKY